jgi:DHA3 family macrolide efflux protein-like MFS transporter
MTESARSPGMREVLAIPALRRLTLAQLVSVFGDFLAIFAVFSIVSFRLRGSPAQVSGILVAYMLPQAFVGLLAGVFVDRWNVKRTMIVSDLLRAGLVVALVFSTQLWQIYAVLISLSVVSSFFAPAQTIGLRSLVPKEALLSANALMMQAFQVTQILSPGVAALLIRLMNETACFWLDALTFVASAALVSTLPIERKIAGPAKAWSTVFGDLTEGVRFIFTHATLAFTIVSMAAGLFAVRCYSALIAVYVRDILHASTGTFGALGTMVGAGMIAGTQAVTRIGRTRSKEHMMLGGLFLVSAGILCLAIFGNVPVTFAATLVLGVGVALVIIPAQTLMQGQTPMEMLGRVTSSLMSVLAAAQVAGLLVSGSIAQAVGIRNSYFATSGLMLAIAGVGWRVVERRKAAAQGCGPLMKPQ